MELLDRGNTSNYGHPVPTVVPLTPTPGLISPNLFKLLSEKYHLQPITLPERDLAACLA